MTEGGRGQPRRGSGRSGARRSVASDLRGATRLVVEATQGVSGIVEDMQGPTLGIAGLVHWSVRAVTRLVGGGLDAALAPFVHLLGETRTRPELEALLAALNGVLGDHLAATGNPLAIPMELRRDGVALDLERRALARALPRATGKVLVLVHGSCMDDLRWRRNGHEHGEALERDLGYTTVRLRYNSGLHVSTNGKELAAILERLVRAWPVPVKELSILAHSMGGLVSRSACHEAVAKGLQWPRKLRAMVFLGTPHHGAPAERAGNLVNVVLAAAPFTGPLARLPRIRSAGVTDLRHGNVLDSDWEGRDRFRHGPDPRTPVPLPRGVRCFAIAASTARGPDAPARGDTLVTVDSALGRHPDPAFDLRFPAARRWVAWGTDHLGLLDRPEVYERIRGWMGARLK
ncbi:MAG TPA: alpha/beta hydrolase [Anaeromyxobacteraceae bacterium]|nr:alpha/beta hydrolase [Anaeromyxobacteraceae bacterium]